MSIVSALFRRELKSYFATPVAYVFIVIFLVLMGTFTFYLGGFYEQGQADLRSFFNFHPWLYLFLIPAISIDRMTGQDTTRFLLEERQSAGGEDSGFIVGVLRRGSQRWPWNGALSGVATLDGRRQALAAQHDRQAMLGAGLDANVDSACQVAWQRKAVDGFGERFGSLSNSSCPAVDDLAIRIERR